MKDVMIISCEYQCVQCRREFLCQSSDPSSAVCCPACGSIHLQARFTAPPPPPYQEFFDPYPVYDEACDCDSPSDPEEPLLH